MADVFPLEQKFAATVAVDGLVGSYGSTSDENPVGGWNLQFIPDLNWTGSIAVVGRSPRISTADLSVPWIPVPYRRICLNNVAQDWAIVPGSDPNWVIVVTGPCMIEVPCNGFAVGLLFAVGQGTCQIRANKFEGAGAP